ncbi:MAG: glucose-1-phosphate adenylyltransferase subunit GlgD [Eubacteriaceae bacterium]
MKNAIGLILNVDGEDTTLKPFLQHRSLSTLPFGGRYRLIDFTMSNMVNSGLSHIGIVGSHKYSSLVDHLGTGKEWNLSRKTQDLSLLSGSSSNRIGSLIKINLRTIQNNRAFLEYDTSEHVIISTPNLITTFNFKSAYEIHTKNDSDVTLIFKKDDPCYNILEDDIYLEFDKNRVSGIHYKKHTKTNHFFAEMLIIKKSVLLTLLDLGERTGDWDLMDMIKENVDTLKVFGAPHIGYIQRINDLDSYLNTSMDLLEFNVMQELFLGANPIYTKIKDNHPTLYGDDAIVSNSIVGSGCSLDGSISHSIVFRDTIVKEKSLIENSIIMQKCNIGKNVTLNYVVLDKDTTIRDNASLIGQPHAPIVCKKGTVI